MEEWQTGRMGGKKRRETSLQGEQQIRLSCQGHKETELWRDRDHDGTKIEARQKLYGTFGRIPESAEEKHKFANVGETRKGRGVRGGQGCRRGKKSGAMSELRDDHLAQLGDGSTVFWGFSNLCQDKAEDRKRGGGKV